MPSRSRRFVDHRVPPLIASLLRASARRLPGPSRARDVSLLAAVQFRWLKRGNREEAAATGEEKGRSLAAGRKNGGSLAAGEENGEEKVAGDGSNTSEKALSWLLSTYLDVAEVRHDIATELKNVSQTLNAPESMIMPSI
ncbi:hypothetical protein E2562_018355 [Oryza meyeriana var. granulata]|uniref:Uncharacterized protein n=1 Tax=Oryza meyeriana var. granulata TaxID=110450 RepID=A0A6G1D5E4_9ORYZ|nr:hypothetical protein E2562_018355 [Oryza meyeriana var. granulata]